MKEQNKTTPSASPADVNIEMKIIAHIVSDFDEKFGIPRQSGLAPSAQARIVFEPEFRTPDAIKGIEGFSHLWILWQFSKNLRSKWSPVVRPPRLGGNKTLGVFATRSPFRPNPIGLSCVTLDHVEFTQEHGPVLHILGADLMNGTPIYDIKPYVPYADCHPNATGGFTQQIAYERLQVEFPSALQQRLPEEKRQPAIEVLAQDPRPSYHHDPERVYGMSFAGYNIRFQVAGDVLTVVGVETTEE